MLALCAGTLHGLLLVAFHVASFAELNVLLWGVARSPRVYPCLGVGDHRKHLGARSTRDKETLLFTVTLPATLPAVSNAPKIVHVLLLSAFLGPKRKRATMRNDEHRPRLALIHFLMR
jgi:hypothetical protein